MAKNKKNRNNKNGVANKVSRKDLTARLSSQRTHYDMNSIINGYNPNEFMSRKGYITIEKMLRESQIASLFELKKAFLLSPGISYILEEDTDNPEYQRHLEFIKVNFNKVFKGSVTQALEDVLSAYEYGFSFGEKMRILDSAKEFREHIWLKELKFVYPGSIDFFTDDYGEIDKVMQRGVSISNISGTPLNYSKFVHYVNKQKFGNPYGKSDLERVYREWFIKDLVLKYWGIYLQKYAAPFPVGKVSPGASGQEIDKFLQMIESIQQRFGMVIPKDFELELHHTARDTGDAYAKALFALQSSIARGVLVPDLLGFGNEIKGGSHALGNKQFEIFINVIIKDQHAIENVWNEQVIKELIDINFGPQEVYPVMRFNQFKVDELKEFLKLFLDYVEKGLPVTMEDINHFRGKLNFPEVNEDDQLIIRDKGQPNEPESERKEQNEDESTEENTDPQEEVSHFVMSNRRPTKYEKRIDFIREARMMEKLEKRISIDAARVFMRTKAALKNTIARKKIVEDKRYAEIETLTLKYLGDVKDIFNSGFEEIYASGYANARREVSSLKKKVRFTKFAAGPSDLLVTSQEAKQIAEELINAKTFQAVGKLKDDILNAARATLINGIEKGASTRDMMKALDEIFNGVVLGAATDELVFTPALLESIIRTNSNNFYNLARRQFAREPKNTFIKMFMYSAIMDDRVTERCASLDGFISVKEDPIWDSITPPNHFNCRSVIRYITEVDVDLDSITPSPESQVNVDALERLPGGKGFIKANKPAGPPRLSGGKNE